MSASPDRHATLISLFTTLYTILADQQYTPTTTIAHPPHLASIIDAAAAKEAKFTSLSLLALLLRLPYLITDIEISLAYETLPLVYINNPADPDASASAFDFARDPAYQDRTDLFPADMLVLTRANNGGETLLYELETRRIRVWNHFHDEGDDWTGAQAWDIEDERNPLAEWIRKWIGLERMLVPDGGGGWRFVEFEGAPVAVGVGDRDGELRRVFGECGWNVGAWEGSGGEGGVAARAERARGRAVQGFNAGEFLRQREGWTRAGRCRYSRNFNIVSIKEKLCTRYPDRLDA